MSKEFEGEFTLLLKKYNIPWDSNLVIQGKVFVPVEEFTTLKLYAMLWQNEHPNESALNLDEFRSVNYCRKSGKTEVIFEKEINT